MTNTAAQAVKTPSQVLSNIKDLLPELAGDDQRNELVCLSLALYHEARDEPAKGEIAVGFVILNRIKQTNATICDTVWEGNGKQFPWVKKSSAAIIPKEMDDWYSAQIIALQLLHDAPFDFTKGALYFYNHKVCGCRLPGTITMVVANHTFVRSEYEYDGQRR